MKVIIASGGRFHAFHLAYQLEKRNALKRLYTGYYSQSDNDYMSRDLIKNNNYFKYINYFLLKLKLYKFINKSKIHQFQDNLFDKWLSKKIVQEDKFDIFVGWANYWANSFNNIKKTGAKIILESGSTHILEQQKLLEREYKDFGAKFLPINKKTLNKVLFEYELADYIMSPSNFTRDSFIKHGIKESKLLKVNYGVDYEFFSQFKKQEPEKFRVIFVGLVGLRKGVQYLIKAWQKLNLPEDKCELLFVGNILADIKPFLNKIKFNNNIVFYGSTDRVNLANLYSKSSLFALPSIEEGLSMTIAQAMSCGLPVICTTNTGAQDIVTHNQDGFIIPIRDIDALAKKILYCYQNKDACKIMGNLAKQNASKFTWDNYGQNIYEIYRKII
ncbi:MAG: Glycosyl transferase group 1 [candidate division TM6 bacterium GW2011_GWF2_28_16]|nr:MAG: Glycosyl transferase group 1 [candidate division TM6 bacterium GW2011_GWF2_28_16]